jgi:hypothetical protein
MCIYSRDIVVEGLACHRFYWSGPERDPVKTSFAASTVTAQNRWLGHLLGRQQQLAGPAHGLRELPFGTLYCFPTAVSHKLGGTFTREYRTHQLKVAPNAAIGVQQDAYKVTHLCIIGLHKTLLTQKYRIRLSLLHNSNILRELRSARNRVSTVNPLTVQPAVSHTTSRFA